MSLRDVIRIAGLEEQERSVTETLAAAQERVDELLRQYDDPPRELWRTADVMKAEQAVGRGEGPADELERIRLWEFLCCASILGTARELRDAASAVTDEPAGPSTNVGD